MRWGGRGEEGGEVGREGGGEVRWSGVRWGRWNKPPLSN